jgi:multiple sugar transport system substrate-binding protein
MKKRMLVALALLAATVALATAAPKQVTITWGYWGSPQEVTENKAVAAAFEAKNPDIKIEHMTAPWGDYFTKLQTQFAAKSAPDVLFLTNISTYAPTGVLMDLGPLFKKHGFDKAKYPAGTLGLFIVNGKLYGTPRDNDTKVVYVNKALFKEAGIAVPAGSWSADAFLAAAQKLTKRKADGSPQYGLAFDPGNWYLWAYMFDGRFFDDDAKPTKVAFDKSALAGLQYEGDLISKYKVAPAFDQLNDGTVRQQLFLNGQVAMLIDNHSQVPTLSAASGLDWDVAPLPTVAGKPHANVAGGAGYCIYSGTKKPDAAWRFWLFLNTEGIKLYMKSDTMVPASLDLLKSPEFSGNRSYNAKVFIDETIAGHSFPTTPAWWDVYSKASPSFERIWVGESSAEAAYAEALPELQKLIKK